MSEQYKRFKRFLHSTFNDSDSEDPDPEEDMFKFQPMKMCLEYESNKKRTLKYPKNLPMPRSGHRIVCNSHHVISYGGYNPRSEGLSLRGQSELYKEIWKFDLVHKKWRLLNVPDTPPYAASNCCTLIGNNIFTIFGGTSFPFGLQSNNDLYVLDLNCEKEFCKVTGVEAEEKLRKGNKPPGRYGQSVIIHDNHLYTVGGTTGFVYSMDVHCLDLISHVWTCLYDSNHFGPGDPEPRYRHEVALYCDHIYLLGGGTELQVFSLENIHSFNINTHQWHMHHTHPDPQHAYPPSRKCHALSQGRANPAHLLIFGGVGHVAPVLGDIWRLDLISLTWTKLKLKLAAPLYFHALATSPQDKIYIFGGIASTRRDSDTEEEDEDRNENPSSEAATSARTADLYSVYVTVPSLQEMVNEAVKYYYRTHVYSKQLLSSYGVQL